jgi:CTP-dependent riboflavin kinase
MITSQNVVIGGEEVKARVRELGEKISNGTATFSERRELILLARLEGEVVEWLGEDSFLMVRESYFQEYVRSLGFIKVEFDGEDYWVRKEG